MIFCALGAFILASTLTRTANVAKLTERSRQYTVNVCVAEAATEKIISRMLPDFRKEGGFGIAANLNSYRTNIPTAAETPYWTNFIFSDAQGADGYTYVNCISNWTYLPLESQYRGLWGNAAKYRVLSNARNLTGPERITAAVQQDVQLAQIPIFQFAVFYNGLLEFTMAYPLTIRGRVHANGDIYTGSADDLTFYSTVTSTKGIYKQSWGGFNLSSMSGSINYLDGYSTNVPSMTLPIGTTNTPTAVREIINLPPASESMSSPLGTNRYFNKAEMTLLVSNTTVTAQIRSLGGFDPSPAVLSWPTNKLPYFLSVTNTFLDKRETKTIRATQIDIGKYNAWALTNTTVASKLKQTDGTNNVPNVLYVADFRTVSSSMLSGVRLTNGAALPWRGLTVATPEPLYTVGNYNCPTSYLNTTNTTQTKPASLVSDALTILSGAWRDADSAGPVSLRDSVNTTVNAAIMTGIVYSDAVDGNPYSGGVMNLPRLLEDWDTGKHQLTLNTAIVNMFDSHYATNIWVAPNGSSGYYTPPVRDFNFDLNFMNVAKLPAGTPGLSAIIRSKWVNPPPGVTNYAGN